MIVNVDYPSYINRQMPRNANTGILPSLPPSASSPAAAPGSSSPATQTVAPPNPGNLILNHEVELYRRAIRTPKRSGTAAADGYGSVIHLPFDIAGAGPQTIVPATAGARIGIVQIRIWNTAVQTVQILDGDAVDLDGPIVAMGAGVGLFTPYQETPPLYRTSPGNAFKIAGSAAAQITGFVKYKLLEP